MKGITNKISVGEKIGYGLGDTASNLFFQITIYFIMFFYTDVFGLDPKDVATMFLFTRIWDAVNDPIMGAIADKTKTKWGTYRPFLLWIAVPFGIIFLLTFTTPSAMGLEFSYGMKLVYAYVTYTLMMMIYTAINVPYAALMGVISPSATERTVISTFRFVLVFIAQFVVQFALLYMVKFFGNGTETDVIGWQRAIMVLAVVAVVLFLITFFTTKERAPVVEKEKHSFMTNLKDLGGNLPWLLIAGATVFQLTFICLRGGDIAFYFKHYIGDQEVGSLGVVTSTVLTTSYMLIGTFFTIGGAVLTKWFVTLLGKSRTYAAFMLITALSCAAVFFLKPSQIIPLFILQFITSFAMGPVSVLQWAIYTDTAEYQEWKNNRRSTAFIMAASLFALKMGVAFGGAALGWILSGYGYDKTLDIQPETAKHGMHMAMSIYSALAALGAMVFMLFYPLNKTKLESMEADLQSRRIDDENNAAAAAAAEATA